MRKRRGELLMKWEIFFCAGVPRLLIGYYAPETFPSVPPAARSKRYFRTSAALRPGLTAKTSKKSLEGLFISCLYLPWQPNSPDQAQSYISVLLSSIRIDMSK